MVLALAALDAAFAAYLLVYALRVNAGTSPDFCRRSRRLDRQRPVGSNGTAGGWG